MINHHIEVFSMILVGFPSIMDERSGPHTLQFVSLFRTSTIYLLLVYSLSENSYPKAFAWKFSLFSFLFFPFLLNYFLFVFSYFKSNIVDFLSITIFFEIPDFLKKMHFILGMSQIKLLKYCIRLNIGPTKIGTNFFEK